MNPSDPDMPSNPEPGEIRPSTTGDEAPAKPARKRRAPRKAAEGERVPAGDSGSANGAEQAGAVPGHPGDDLSPTPPERRVRDASAQNAGGAAAEAGAGSGEASAQAAGEPGSSEAEAGPQGQGVEGRPALEGERSRRRNRRRGRNKDRARNGAPGSETASPALLPLAPADVSEVFAQVVSGAFDEDAPESASPPELLLEGQTAPVPTTGGTAEAQVSAAAEEEPAIESVFQTDRAPVQEAPAAASGSTTAMAGGAGEGQPGEVEAGAGDSGEGDAEDGADLATAGPPLTERRGDFAAESAAPMQAKRVLSPDVDAPKLHKVLAQSGVGSRRDLEQMIAEGRVSVNGEAAHTGQRISFGDRIAIDGKPVRVRIAPPPARVIAYHKPVGEVVTHDDPQQRPTVFRRLPRLPMGKWQSVGRLDINTEGLLLFTTSGELANQLMHPRFGLEREYAVRVLGTLDDEARARLLAGVDVDGQKAVFLSIEDGGGEGSNHWYRVVIAEGRNREVRKLFDAVGLTVSRLIRIRYGSVVLPRGLKRGVWVELPESDLRTLRRMTGTARPAREGRGEDDAGAKPGRGKRGKRSRGGPRREGEGPALSGSPQPGFENKQQRPVREPREPREPRAPKREPGEGGRIPNPLQQTFDKRAIREARAPRRELGEDGPIPNPLQQTFDKRALREDRAPRREYGEDGPIPNPLQQTFDKRAMRDASALRRDPGEDGPIPNPLQQTFDKRAMRAASTPRREQGEDGPIPNPLQQTFDKRFAQKSRGPQGGRPKKAGGGGGGSPKQPDPMQTSVGYIGADAFRKGGRGGRGGGGRGGGAGGPGRGAGGRGR